MCLLRMLAQGCAYAAVLGALTGSVMAQWSSPFAAPGPDEKVQALLMHDDGSGNALYAAGQFRAIDGQIVSKIARYRDGAWSDLAGGVQPNESAGRIAAMVEFEGDLIVTGQFSNIGGTSAENIARWDGSEWHPLGNGITSARALLVVDGELFAGGFWGSSQASAVVRWNGSAWESLGELHQNVNALAVYQGELIAAGSLSSYQHIVRWTGTSWESIGGGTNGQVRAITEFEGDLIATGLFSTAGGSAAQRIARWNGKAWQPMGALAVAGFGFGMHNGRLIVGGVATAAGSAGPRLAEWDGSQWVTLAGGVQNDLSNAEVHAMLTVAEPRGESLVVGGWFSIAGDACANNIARMSAGGWQRLTECPTCLGLSGPVRPTFASEDQSTLYVGGACLCAGTSRVNRIMQWDGSQWSALGMGVDGNGRVNAITEYDDGTGGGPKVFIAGIFSSVDGVPASNIAMWDGSQWHAVGGGVAGGAVFDLQVFDDGSGAHLYAGGGFTSAGGQAVIGMARWDGQQWSDVDSGINSLGRVFDLLVWDDGDGAGLYVGGLFDRVGPASRPVFAQSIARWRDGAWSQPFALGLAGYVKSMTIAHAAGQDRLVCAGYLFANSGPIYHPLKGLAMWNGTVWQDVSPPRPLPNLQVDANVVFSTQAGGCSLMFMHGWYPPAFIKSWNGAVWREMSGGITDASGVVWAQAGGSGTIIEYASFAMFQNRLYVAGDFTSAGGLPASNIAIWDVEASLSCLGDMDGDNAVNINDLLAIINHWGPCVDCPADPSPCGGDGQVNINDLLEVINQWGPCP